MSHWKTEYLSKIKGRRSMPVAVSLNWRGQGSRRTSLMHLKRYRGGKSREIRMKRLLTKRPISNDKYYKIN